jgi:hypothetical protein
VSQAKEIRVGGQCNSGPISCCDEDSSVGDA